MRGLVFLFCSLSLTAWSWAQTTVNLEQQVQGELPVANGGTGGDNGSDARDNLGLTTDYLDEDHVWRGRQDVLNLNGLRYAHLFANGGDGSSGNPWTFAAGHPWADAVADGGETIILTAGTYLITSCPAIVPGGVTIWGFNRNQVDFKVNCHGIRDRLAITGATNATPIEITTSTSHGLTTGDWVNITGVPGNNAANGDWQVTLVNSTSFTLDGSVGNGDYVAAQTGYWAAKIFKITNISMDSPVELTTSMPHNLASGSLALTKDISGSFGDTIKGKVYIDSTGTNTMTVQLSARREHFLSGGTVRGLVPVDAISTQTGGKNIIIRGLSMSAIGSEENLLKNLIGFLASESVVEEVSAAFMDIDDFDVGVSNLLNARSAAITVTGDATPGQTIDLEMTGGGSRAAGPYATYTATAATLPAIDSILSPAGGLIRLAFVAAHGLSGDGEIVTISSTAETTAAGAAGTWKVFKFSGTDLLLVNSSGTGTDCTAGCGGATATETTIRAAVVARELASHLNSEAIFFQDYTAIAEGEFVRLQERRFGGSPSTFVVTSAIPHTTSAWASTGRGGNALLALYSNAFSSKFSRIGCGGTHFQFHCVTVQGINNQHSFRDIRLSGGNRAGWGMRFTPTSNIQNMSVDTMTVEASYGGIEIGSLTGSKIAALYMEGADEYGVLINDLGGSAQGSSFVHANTISSGFLLGDSGLIMEKGRDLAVENTIISGECKIGMQCENCTIRSSFSGRCTNESPSGYLLNHSASGKPPRPVDRYGKSLATGTASLLSKPITNYVLQSEDLSASPWFGNGGTFLTSTTGPFGVTQQVSRNTVASPTFGQSLTMGQQTLTGLVPDTVYLLSYWLRVVTAAATCNLPDEAGSVNRALSIGTADGWIRIAGAVRSNGSGNHTFPVRCAVGQGGLPEFTYDVFGVMVSDLQTDGALPAYVSTTTAVVTIPPGMYAESGELSGILSHLPRCKTYQVVQSELTAAAATEDITLFQVPARGVMSGVTIKHETPFTGGTLTGMTVSVGDSSGATAYAPAFDIFQAASDTAFSDSAVFKSTTFAARDVLARFFATGDTVQNAAAGAVDITACFAVRP